MRGMLNQTRGVNSVIAIVLLIAVTVAAVAAFYIFYGGFFKQSSKKVSMNIASVTLQGPSTGYEGYQVVISVKNSGNVDFVTWTFVEGATASGTDLKASGQVSFSTPLTGPGPWTFKVVASTQGAMQTEDIWVIKNA